MQQTFNITRTSRQMVFQFLEKYTLEQLNTIPEGFSNNLIWNIGHIVISQQLLVYKLSGMPMLISDELIEKYRKGSQVVAQTSQIEVDEIKKLLFSLLDKTEEDFNNGIFINFTEYPTSTGFTLNNINDALCFNLFHEGLHIGIMMSIRKFL